MADSGVFTLGEPAVGAYSQEAAQRVREEVFDLESLAALIDEVGGDVSLRELLESLPTPFSRQPANRQAQPAKHRRGLEGMLKLPPKA